MNKNMLYTGEFYKGQKEHSYLSAKKILPLVLAHMKVSSIADFGCGTGSWLRAAIELGIEDVAGYDFGNVEDQLMIPKELFHDLDLTVTTHLGRVFDLVMSLEVAEHLPPNAADNFVTLLTRHSNVILFSAAVPGQGGMGHLNEQRMSYWIERFKPHGFAPVDIIRPQIWNDREIPFWYRQNVILFVKTTKCMHCFTDDLPPLSFFDVVHPDIFEEREYYYQSRIRALENNIYSLQARLDKIVKCYTDEIDRCIRFLDSNSHIDNELMR